MAAEISLYRQGLSFLINDKFRIFAVFFVCADKQKIHIGNDAKATIAAKFALQLTAEIGSVILEEFHRLSVRQAVFQIDKAARQNAQVFNLW